MFAAALLFIVFFALFADPVFATVVPALGPRKFGGEDGEAGRNHKEGGTRQNQESNANEEDGCADDSD